jgi:lipopolysaccharide/colanic/teichoic acid biosynthesis glycosyltransferase
MIYNITKACIDRILSLCLMVLLSPLFIIICAAIQISDGLPIFYRWKVVGKDGHPFVGYKFRSMVVNADDLKGSLQADNEMGGPVFKMTKDPRITPLGKLMRKYSIDELPQLFSVFMGDMSLVGPRPPLESEYQKFDERQKQKMNVKPGITCLWQVNGRNEINTLDEWVTLDLKYIDNRSFLLDMKILFQTVLVVVRGTGK